VIAVTNDNFYSELIRWALSHEDGKIGMRELAEYSGYSQRYLNRLFSQRTGMGMSTFIRLRKLAAASEELIHSDKTIAEIAERYHYESQHTFTQSFRRQYGVWRKENRVDALRENPAQCPADKA